MSTGSTPTPADGATNLPPSWRRLLALSGVAFAVLFLFGWFANGGLTPHHDEPDQEWTNWARDDQWSGRISAFLMLLSAFVFVHFLGAIRSVLGMAESRSRGAEQLARVAFGGGLTGMAGVAMASITLAAASTYGSDVDPVVSKAVATGCGRPFPGWRNGVRGLPPGRGAANAADEGLRTLDRDRRAGRRGAFLITSLTILDGTTDGSPFGLGFFPGVLALVIWSIATSIALYRVVPTTARELVAQEADA